MSSRSGKTTPESDRKTKRIQTRITEETNSRLSKFAAQSLCRASEALQSSIETMWWATFSETSHADTVRPKPDNHGEVRLLMLIDEPIHFSAERQENILRLYSPELNKKFTMSAAHTALSKVKIIRQGSLTFVCPWQDVFGRIEDRGSITEAGFQIDPLRAETNHQEGDEHLLSQCEMGQRGTHLLKLVSRLRMALNGSENWVSPITLSMEAAAVRWIRWRITDGWHRSMASRDHHRLDVSFNDGVRAMASAVCEVWNMDYPSRSKHRP
jgi:hypothetical protein